VVSDANIARNMKYRYMNNNNNDSTILYMDYWSKPW